MSLCQAWFFCLQSVLLYIITPYSPLFVLLLMSRGADLLILIFDKDRLSYLDHAAMYHGEVFETLVGSGAGKFIPRTE